MSASIPAATATRLEKAAVDNGFDRALPREGTWLVFASTQACETDVERLDVFNGLLLAPHLDAAFDRGFLSVADDRTVLVSPRLAEPARRILGLDVPRQVVALADGHRSYLSWHRERLFLRSE